MTPIQEANIIHDATDLNMIDPYQKEEMGSVDDDELERRTVSATTTPPPPQNRFDGRTSIVIEAGSIDTDRSLLSTSNNPAIITTADTTTRILPPKVTPSSSSVLAPLTMNTNDKKRSSTFTEEEEEDDDEEEEGGGTGMMKSKMNAPLVDNGSTATTTAENSSKEMNKTIDTTTSTGNSGTVNTTSSAANDSSTTINDSSHGEETATKKKRKKKQSITPEENTHTAQGSTVPTSNTANKRKKPKSNTTGIQRVLAPSTAVYLRQRNIPNTAENQETPILKYLPRPEWLGTPYYLMRMVLRKIENKYNFDLSNVVDMYKHDFLQCLIESTIDDNDDIGEKLDFVMTHIKSNVMYYDVKNTFWGTKPIHQSTPLSGIEAQSADRLDSNAMLLPSDHQHNVTFESLILQRRIDHAKNRGKTGSTILHRAIEKNATHIALDIIRIEYNSFLDCVRQNNDLKKCVSVITLLETADCKDCTPLILAAQMGNLVIVEALLNCGVSLHGLPLENRPGSLQPTAMIQAAYFGQVEVVECMIQYYKLHTAERLLEPNASFWPKTLEHLIERSNENKTTPLMRAAQQGHISVVNQAWCKYL
jgi:hypothetical protein